MRRAAFQLKYYSDMQHATWAFHEYGMSEVCVCVDGGRGVSDTDTYMTMGFLKINMQHGTPY